MPFFKPCREVGCPDDAIGGTPYCESHQRRAPKKKRGKHDWIYGHRRWRPTRLYVLKRDGYTCQLCGRNETDVGVQNLVIDHIGGDYSEPFNPDKLRTLCRSCSGSEDGGRRSSPAPVGVVRH